MALQKVPPPPPVANLDPVLNRWFLELTSFIDANGTIDPGNVGGLPQLQVNVANLITEVAVLTPQVAGLSTTVTALSATVAALSTTVGTLNTAVTALQARAQVFNGTADPAAGLGNNGDWFANTSGGAGHRIFVKVAGTWLAFPF